MKICCLIAIIFFPGITFAEDSWLCKTEKFVAYLYEDDAGFKEINFDPTQYTIKKTNVTAQGRQVQKSVYGFFGMEEGGKPYSTGTEFNEHGVLIMDGWFKVMFNPTSLRFSFVDVGGYALTDQFKHIPTSLAMGKCKKTT